jgi:hypothetical protein
VIATHTSAFLEFIPMLRSRLLTTIALISATCCALSGIAHAQEPAPKTNDADNDLLVKLDPIIGKAIKANPSDTPLRKLQKERCTDEGIAFAKLHEKILNAQWKRQNFEPFLDRACEFFEDLLALMETSEDKIKCHELRIKILKEFEEFTSSRVQIGNGNDPPQYLNLAKAARLDAEIDLLKFKTEKPSGR